MYASSVLPSVSALVPIFTLRGVIFWCLVYEATIKLLLLATHPASEAYIWTSENWSRFALRRVVVDFVINILYPLTQTILTTNWILNLIPLILSIVNVFMAF